MNKSIFTKNPHYNRYLPVVNETEFYIWDTEFGCRFPFAGTSPYRVSDIYWICIAEFMNNRNVQRKLNAEEKTENRFQPFEVPSDDKTPSTYAIIDNKYDKICLRDLRSAAGAQGVADLLNWEQMY